VPLFAVLLATIAFVPIDDRPVTAQLPVMLGRIAGVAVHAPPRALLGRFIDPGRPDALIAWLNNEAVRTRRFARSRRDLRGRLLASARALALTPRVP